MAVFLVKIPGILGVCVCVLFCFVFYYLRTFPTSGLKYVIHLVNRDDCYGDLTDVWFQISNVRTKGQQNYSHF